MRIENPGYRRLYDSIECSIESTEEHKINFELDNFYVQVYFGPEPLYGIDLTRKDVYGTPGTSIQLPSNRVKKASDSDYPRHFFTEIACWRKTNSVNSQPNILLENQPEFSQVADIIAGCIGLRFHHQFVRTQICENIILLKGGEGQPGDHGFDFVKTNSFEIVQKVDISQEQIDNRIVSESHIIHGSKSNSGRLALIWLLRAWKEVDDISKFLSLFIPLEVLLQGYSPPKETNSEINDEIISLITEHAEIQQEKLLKHFDHLMQYQNRPPSLASRFELMARHVNFDNSEKDIAAFKIFNKFRNSLIHRGNQSINLLATINNDAAKKDAAKKEVQQLQDLTERYVNWALFNDHEIYKVFPNSVGYHNTRVK